MSVISRAFCALGVFVMLASLHAEAKSTADVSPYLHPQQLVDVGGRRMNLYCTGSGSPTVVLATDGDDGTSAWRFVQPVVARRTRVCSYDAPGLGFSDPIRSPLDANAAVHDLHEMLVRAGITGPSVIVGYSLSGLYARLYADRYPSDVAGMVLVSPNVTNQDQRMAAVAPSLAPMLSMDTFLRTCVTAAQRKAIQPNTTLYARCVYSPPDPTIPPVLLDQIHAQWQGAALWRSFASAMRESDQSSAEVLREQHGYGNMPLIVLTTTRDILALPIPASQKTALTRAWIGWHQQIAKLSSRGVDFIVNGSTSSIPIDRPAAVTSAIEEVLDQARH